MLGFRYSFFFGFGPESRLLTDAKSLALAKSLNPKSRMGKGFLLAGHASFRYRWAGPLTPSF